MSRKKVFRFGKDNCFIEDLKHALDNCSNDSRFELVLCTNETEKEDAVVSRLKDLCSKMYKLLYDASACIDKCAEKEKKHDQNSIYYEGDKGYNVGARQLSKDVSDFLKCYHKELVQIDLAR